MEYYINIKPNQTIMNYVELRDLACTHISDLVDQMGRTPS